MMSHCEMAIALSKMEKPAQWTSERTKRGTAGDQRHPGEVTLTLPIVKYDRILIIFATTINIIYYEQKFAFRFKICLLLKS